MRNICNLVRSSQVGSSNAPSPPLRATLVHPPSQMNVSLRFERFKGHSTLGRPMPESFEQKLPLPSASEREVLRVIAANSFDHSTDRDDSGMALQPKLGFLSERCPRNH